MQNSFLYYLDKKLCGYEKYVKLAPYHGRQLPQRDTEFYYALNHEEAAGVLDVYNVDLRVPGTSLILLRKK
jgi:hypothetical protein